MAEIKSALELALERTEDVEVDRESLKKHEIQQEGKKIVSKFLQDLSKDSIKEDLKGFSGKERKWAVEGAMNVLLANLILPKGDTLDVNLTRLKEACKDLLKDNERIEYIFKQIEQFFSRYLEDKNSVKEQLLQQYGPRLEEKRRQLAQQTGQQINLPPEADPEFAQILQKNMAHLDSQYQEVVGQIRDEIKDMPKKI
ncbi:MAG: DUF6657 family protein [Spirochaetia bacterium]